MKPFRSEILNLILKARNKVKPQIYLFLFQLFSLQYPLMLFSFFQRENLRLGEF